MTEKSKVQFEVHGDSSEFDFNPSDYVGAKDAQDLKEQLRETAMDMTSWGLTLMTHVDIDALFQQVKDF